jgi:cobalt-precorrin 5A hydrolase
MKLAIIAATDKGWTTAIKLGSALPGSEIVRPIGGIRQTLEALWQTHDGIICIMATGIVIRCLNGLCQSKYSDPCVVVLDENGTFAISLLAGHIGGGNQLALKIAELCKGTPVITTASDVSGHTSVDLWSIEHHLVIANPKRLAPVSAKLLNQGTLGVFQERNYLKSLPDDFFFCENRSAADIVISISPDHSGDALLLLPRTRYIGVGCRRGTPLEAFQAALRDLENEGVDLRTVAALASLDLKKDEEALLEIAKLRKWPLRFFPKEILNEIEIPSGSEMVYQKVGTHSVSEASAIRAAACDGTPGRLIVRKIKWNQITMAVAEKAF